MSDYPVRDNSFHNAEHPDNEQQLQQRLDQAKAVNQEMAVSY